MPTALELTREGWKSYLEGARRRLVVSELTDADKRELENLLQRVREAAGVLKSRFGARRVLLFGSLAQPHWFQQASDVDLAVEGLKSGKDYWEAWGAVEEIISDRMVDLIEVETASSIGRNRLFAEVVILKRYHDVKDFKRKLKLERLRKAVGGTDRPMGKNKRQNHYSPAFFSH